MFLGSTPLFKIHYDYECNARFYASECLGWLRPLISDSKTESLTTHPHTTQRVKTGILSCAFRGIQGFNDDLGIS